MSISPFKFLFAALLSLSPLTQVLAYTGMVDPCEVLVGSNLPAVRTRSLVADLVHEDPLTQLMLWEQTSNTKRWAKPTEPQSIDLVEVSAEALIVRKTEGTVPDIMNSFKIDGDTVLWPRHPLNSDLNVPHAATPTNITSTAYYSASRSMFFNANGTWFSIKMPTNRPHPSALPQEGKSDLKNSADISVSRSRHIESVDNNYGVDSRFQFLLDRISVADKNTRNGFVIRDLTPLQDGHYYFPAFSIPYAGREIATRLGVDHQKLFGEAFAAALGYAKGLLLIRYGLQMKTPNAQNILLQLDEFLLPTGKIFFRDISDSNYFPSVAEGLGFGERVNEDKAKGYSVVEHLSPDFSNSFWQMDEGRLYDTDGRWERLHDDVYVATVLAALGQIPMTLAQIKERLDVRLSLSLQNADYADMDKEFRALILDFCRSETWLPFGCTDRNLISFLDKYLKSKDGMDAIRAWRRSWDR